MVKARWYGTFREAVKLAFVLASSEPDESSSGGMLIEVRRRIFQESSTREGSSLPMPSSTEFLQKLQIQYPIVQAPLAGGSDTPELVTAVSNAGGLGFIGAAYLSPEQILEAGRAVRKKTSRPFGINLFAPTPAPSDKSIEAAKKRLEPYFAELGLPAPAAPGKPTYGFPEQLTAALETGASIFSFTFGVIPSHAISAVKAKGMILAGTATTVEEALALEKAGVDAIVTQGSEAGGHRGTFSGDFAAAMVGTLSLVPQVVDAVRVPVVASGGIMDGRGIAAALALGASAVQMGTAFLTCKESGTPDAYKEAVLHAREDQTRITRAFSGRSARGIVNRFMEEMESRGTAEEISDFPLQNALTRPLRTAAAKQGRAEFLSLWAGQGVRLARRQSAAELIARLVRETDEAIHGLQAATSAQTTKPKAGGAIS
jgi:nitronate monooxygenase